MNELLRNFSHSGAVIGGRHTTRAQAGTLDGEIPSSTPTIRNQVILAQNDPNINPNNIDLIVLDGGINDVGVTTINNPVKFQHIKNYNHSQIQTNDTITSRMCKCLSKC